MNRNIPPNPEKDQFFLIDKEVLKKEIEVSDLTKKDRVIEIGAGKGILTRELAEKTREVLAFEIDPRFKEYLETLKEKNRNLRLEYTNALYFNWRGYNKIVSNIHYSLSEPVIQKAIQDGIKELTLIVGENFKTILELKESKIGIISRLFFRVKPVMKVEKTSFNPPQKLIPG